LHRDEPNPQWDVLSDGLGSERDPVMTDNLVPSSSFAGDFETGVKSSVSSQRMLNDTKLG
jgi:hypothetical protein